MPAKDAQRSRSGTGRSAATPAAKRTRGRIGSSRAVRLPPSYARLAPFERGRSPPAYCRYDRSFSRSFRRNSFRMPRSFSCRTRSRVSPSSFPMDSSVTPSPVSMPK